MYFVETFPFFVFSAFAPLALLFLRIILSIMFIDSGRRHVMYIKSRAESLGLPMWFTFVLGGIEVIGGILILIGWYVQYAAFFLSGVMLGALFFKLFIWKTGMYGKQNDGWYYDALLLAGVGVLFAIGGGEFTIDMYL